MFIKSLVVHTALKHSVTVRPLSEASRSPGEQDARLFIVFAGVINCSQQINNF